MSALNPLQNAILAQAIGYFTAMVMGYIVVNFLSNGFLGTFLRVKASRGKFVLVRIRSALTDFFKTGEIIDNNLIYKGRDKEVKTLALPEDKPVIFRSMNVNAIDVDEAKNAIIAVDWSAITGFDAVKFDNLLTRALMQPEQQDKLLKIILILILVIAGIAIASAFFSYNTLSIVESLNVTTANVISGGNIGPGAGG